MKWEEAIRKEYEAMEENGTWIAVDERSVPPGAQVLPSGRGASSLVSSSSHPARSSAPADCASTKLTLRRAPRCAAPGAAKTAAPARGQQGGPLLGRPHFHSAR